MGGFDRATDVSAIFDADEGPAEAATYTPPGGSAVPTTVILIEGAETQDPETGEILDPTDFALLPRDDVDKPAEGAVIVVDAGEVPHGGETFVVLQPMGEARHYARAAVRKA